MIAYVGDTRSRKLLARCVAEGVGQIIIRGKLSGRRLKRWAFDNGAFVDWRKDRPFDGKQFSADLAKLESLPAPDFCVLPDIVAGGLDSLALSLEWLKSHPRPDWYLAVQDGMKPEHVTCWAQIAGIFIGGSLPWKLETGQVWVAEAHAHGKRCHIGRVGTARRVAWARDIGADSIDSSLPLWSRENAAIFFGALAQQGLFVYIGIISAPRSSASDRSQGPMTPGHDPDPVHCHATNDSQGPGAVACAP